MADKQGIRLKMQEMAILETLIFKSFWESMPPDPLDTRTFGARTNTYDQHLEFSNLGSMSTLDKEYKEPCCLVVIEKLYLQIL